MKLDLITKELETKSGDKADKIEKSPACRMTDETDDECIKRKIPELIDEGMDQEQAVAAAVNICKKPCEEKSLVIKDGLVIKEGRVISKKNKTLISNCINQMGEAIGALEELLRSVDPTEPDESSAPAENKGRNSSRAKENPYAKLVLLKRTSVAIDNVLCSMKKGGEDEINLTLLRIADKVIEAMRKRTKATK